MDGGTAVAEDGAADGETAEVAAPAE